MRQPNDRAVGLMRVDSGGQGADKGSARTGTLTTIGATGGELKVDVCVIGAGSGGLSVAAAAAQLGVAVALIEKHKMGGDCLNYGCVPSKSLIAAARRAHIPPAGIGGWRARCAQGRPVLSFPGAPAGAPRRSRASMACPTSPTRR